VFSRDLLSDMEQTPPNQQQFQAYQAALAAQQYGYGMPGGFQGSMAAAGQHQGYGGWQHSQAPPTGPGYMDHSLHGQQLGHWEVIKSRGFAIMSGRRAQNDVGALMAAVQSARQFPGWPDTFNAWFRTDDTLWGIEGSDNTYSWLIKSVALSLAQGKPACIQQQRQGPELQQHKRAGFTTGSVLMAHSVLFPCCTAACGCSG
jgi:hypothetical protein